MRWFSACTLAACAAALGACGDNSATMRDTQQTPAPASTAAPSQAPAADGAFGYTRAQLEDADIRSPDGAELGEVGAVITDDAGAVIALAVEVEGPDPDPVVRLPLEGLTPVTTGDDRDLQTTMTRDELRALPAWQRR